MIEEQNIDRIFIKAARYKEKNIDNIFHIKYTILQDENKLIENKDRPKDIKNNQVIIDSQRSEKIKETKEPIKDKQVSNLPKNTKQIPKGKKNKNVNNMHMMKKEDFEIYSQFNKINKKKMKFFCADDKKQRQFRQGKKRKQNKNNHRNFNSDSQEELDNLYDILQQQMISKPQRKSRSIDYSKRDQKKDAFTNKQKKVIYQPYIDIQDIQQSREMGEKKYYKGFVDFHQKIKKFAKIITKQIEGDFIAEGTHKNRCIHGDWVYFEIIDDSGQKTKCKIVAILPWEGKGCRKIVGKIQMLKHKNLLYLEPINKRLCNFNIKFSQLSRQSLADKDKKYFLAEITDWKQDSEYPECKIISQFGELGDIETETSALLVNNGVIDEEYDQQAIESGLMKFILQADQNGQYQISKEQIAKRNDLRRDRIFTIDPLTARDFDDALSIEQCGSKDGKIIYEIGVHIADASFFVQQGGVIDSMAQKKTTSVYLVHRVIPMLPRILCQTMCSLNPGLQRLTLSVWFKITEEGQILPGSRYDRTVILSKARFTYEQAQKIIEDKVKSQKEIQPGFGCIDQRDFEKIAEDIKIMNRIAMKLRANRIKGGSLIFQIPKKTFKLSENLYPESYTISQRCQANFLVQEYMLLANQKVGEVLVENIGESALLRRHKFPGPKKIEKFQKFTKSINKTIVVSKQTQIQEQLNEVIKDPKIKKCVKDILNYELIFLLEMAEYFVVGQYERKQWLHYALNMPIYTHFTSPIRRYPDIIVHRQLCAVIDAKNHGKKVEVSDLIYKNMKQLVSRCNQNKLSAKKVSSGCQKIFLCLYLKQNPVNCKAILTDFNEYSLSVCVPDYDFRATIQLKQLRNTKVLQIRSDGSQRKIIDLQCEYQKDGQLLKKKEYLKQMQEIDIRLTAKQEFPIDYKIRLAFPDPNNPEGRIIYE